ncbi:unnamed protein product, partial [Polarella glacialis]
MWRPSSADASLPCTANVELPSFLPLTALYVGRFASTNHAVVFLYVSGFGRSKGRPKRLVLVVVQDEAKQQPAKTLRRCRWAMRDSPFFAPDFEDARPFRGVVTLEIDLGDIAGLDYWNPLLVDASRLVIEARKLTRRWFPDLASCSSHYGWEDGTMRQPEAEQQPTSSQHLATLLSDLYRPCSGNDGRPAGLPQVMPQSENCRLPSKHPQPQKPPSPSKQPQTYWQEGYEEERYKRYNKVFLTAERMLRVKQAGGSPTVRKLEDDLMAVDMAPSSAEESGSLVRSMTSTEEHDGGGGTGGGGDGDGGTGGSAAEGAPAEIQRVASGSREASASSSSSSAASMPVMEVMHNKTVNFRFDDPFLPYVLRE